MSGKAVSRVYQVGELVPAYRRVGLVIKDGELVAGDSLVLTLDGAQRLFERIRHEQPQRVIKLVRRVHTSAPVVLLRANGESARGAKQEEALRKRLERLSRDCVAAGLFVTTECWGEVGFEP